jgi:hypothetical protein
LGESERVVIATIEGFDPGPSAHAAVTALQAQGAHYALIGGLALEAWGIARATRDIDFAVRVGDAEGAAARLQTNGNPLRIGGVGVRDAARKLAIDFVDRRFEFRSLFEDALEEARGSGRVVVVAAREIPLVSREFLLAMKLVSGEHKDDADARRLLALPELEYRAARQIVHRHLGAAAANRLDTLAREIGRSDAPRRY